MGTEGWSPGAYVDATVTPQGLGCARRELGEEAGAIAERWRSPGPYAITLGSIARVHLYEARELTRGLPELTPAEVDCKLSWWSLTSALDSVAGDGSTGKSGPGSTPVGPPAVR
ncbi:hypothetical protein OHB54_25545 [Streptomyces sp. NBC_01007]|nr:hypothetical protein OHB54_25545 [Streptomyces sp. NBC_01007]